MRRFSLTPLILIVIGYIFGILLGNFFTGAKYFWFITIFLSLFGLASVFYFILQRNRGNIALVLFFLAFISLGITRHLKARLLPSNEISRYISFPTPKRTHLTGVVVSVPKRSLEKTDFVLACERLTTDKREIIVTGKTQVFLYTSEPIQIDYGDRMNICGRLSSPLASTNPGVFDYQRYLSHRNVHSLFSVYKSEDIERLGKARISIFRSIIAKIRKRIDYIIKSNLPQLESSILAGVMLGERGGLPRQIQGVFADAGVLHTLAVSGLHVGLVLFIFYAFFRVIGIPKKTTYFLTIIVVIVYAQVAGGRPSAIRASIMATCGLVAILLERDKHLYNSLALAAFIILLFNPFTLFDVGFQLSFMATLGILYLTPHFLDYFRLGKPRRVITYILTSLAVSAGALVGVYPIIAFYFNKISLIALISNILVVPQVAVIISLGFASSILGLFSLSLAQVINIMNRLFIIILFGCIRFFASLPFSFKYVVSPSLIFLSTYYLFFIFLPKMKTSRFARTILLFFPLIFLFSITGKKLLPSKNLSVTFLDVGQGDAIHLRVPNRRDILIDGGGTIGKFDIGEKVVIPYLLKNGISKLDTIFLTHPHYNHIGGLVPILKKFKVKRVYYNSQNYADDLVDEFLQVIGKRKIPLKHMAYGEKVEYNDVKLCILNPRIMRENIDSNSLVIKLSYGDFGILFTGDIDYEAQEELSKEEIESDILQIPNHGKGQISPKFLYKVAPKYGIISTKFKVRKLEEKYSNTRFFSTSKNGAIVIKTDGESFEIEPRRGGTLKELLVIKIGGKLLKEPVMDSHLKNVISLAKGGKHPVIVHGGGLEITEKLGILGKKPRFIEGQRYTDGESLEIVEMVLAGINKRIVGRINLLGGKAVGISGKDGFLVEAKKLKGKHDLGYVAEVERVNPEILNMLLDKGSIPVISPVAMDKKGVTYNINADIFASQFSAAIGAERLAFLTDVPGILENPEDEKSVIEEIRIEKVEKLIRKGTIVSGMIPKINSCVQALQKGVKEIDILDGRRKTALSPLIDKKLKLAGTKIMK